MKTRFVVSAITGAALALGSVASFADAGIPSTWQGVAPSEPQPGQTQVDPRYQAQQWQREQRAAHQWQRDQQWQGNQQWQRDQQWQRSHEARRERERHEHRERNYRDSYGWQRPAYVYQEPAYVYEQPAYVYQQPSYGYEQPGYYQPPYYGYDNADATGNLVIGTILGGLIGSAIAR